MPSRRPPGSLSRIPDRHRGTKQLWKCRHPSGQHTRLRPSQPGSREASPTRHRAAMPCIAGRSSMPPADFLSGQRPERKWRRSDSNRRPPACKAGALPLSYAPAGDGVQQLHPNSKRTTRRYRQRDTALRGSAAQVASPSLRGIVFRLRRNTMVGQGGLEPPTPRLSSVCSNQLSYWPRTRGVAQSGEGCAVGAHRSPHGPQPDAPARSGRQPGNQEHSMRDRSAPSPTPSGAAPARTNARQAVYVRRHPRIPKDPSGRHP